MAQAFHRARSREAASGFTARGGITPSRMARTCSTLLLAWAVRVLGCETTEMGRGHHSGALGERQGGPLIGGATDVDGQTTQVSGVECRGDGRLVEELPSGDVHQEGTSFHGSQLLLADEVLGLRVGGSERDHDVRDPDQLG